MSFKFIAGACMAGLISSAAHAVPAPADTSQRIDRLLARTPLIDGHNDLAWEVRMRFNGDFDKIDLAADTANLPRKDDDAALMTDIPRLRAGHVGGQFWSVWIPTEVTGAAAVKGTLEQIDLVQRMVQRYPKHLAMATTADDIARAFKAGRVASLIGIEGGHQIGNSLPALRQFYAMGARYMTLAHGSRNDWSDSATDDPKHNGLSPFGLAVVHEMNRMGMLVDLSHVSPAAMKAALAHSVSPVIFSHSSARALVDHPRNVPDDVLALVAINGGIVMANFAPGYVSQAAAEWEAELAAETARVGSRPFAGRYVGQPERAKEALDAWRKAHPEPLATLAQVADHIEHMRKVAGIDHVGIGGDLDGIPATPVGLEGVDKYPKLFEELARRGWSDADLSKLASGNILRVLRANETVAARLQQSEQPSNAVYKP